LITAQLTAEKNMHQQTNAEADVASAASELAELTCSNREVTQKKHGSAAKTTHH